MKGQENLQSTGADGFVVLGGRTMAMNVSASPLKLRKDSVVNCVFRCSTETDWSSRRDDDDEAMRDENVWGAPH